jgi:ribonuclease HII
MHECVRDCIKDINVFDNKTFLLIDGNDFKPLSVYDKSTDKLMTLPYNTIEKGDNIYQSIAAASILAKNAHDQYIEELCVTHPLLSERYKLNNNKGYGTKEHIEGILEHGISQWHRNSYARCKGSKLNIIL